MPCNRSRVLLADDHTLVADLCKRLLEPEYDVVGIVKNGRAMIQAAAELKPDVIVVDVAMPILNGLDAGQRVKIFWPAVKLVYLTMNLDPEVAVEAFRCGASGYLLKTCASSEMLVAVREVLNGKSYLSRTLPKDIVNCLRWEHKEMVNEDVRLTARQRDVLQLLVEGKVMKEVGSILKMETTTVAYHKYRIMKALGTHSNAELVRYAVRNHIVAA
jgi:DNA-binding NarL/FixJ family response regulator